MVAPDAYPFTTLTVPARFGLAVSAILVVFLIDQGLDQLIGEGSLFLLLSLAVIASAWLAGTGPALAATVVGALLAAVSRPVNDPGSHAQLALFVIQGLVLTAIISELRTARRLAEQEAGVAQSATREAEAAGRMKDEFLATVSHELRTPLNAVLGWVYLLQTGKLDQQTAHRGLDSIERNARIQSQLTGHLLDLSKALTGRLQVESRPVSLTDVVRQATDAAKSAAAAKEVTIVSDVPDETLVVLGDRSRVRQVIWHLLVNALKFTPRGEAIAIGVRVEGTDAVLKVLDSGPGIDPEFLPRIFDVFTQADPSPTRTAGGLGVGLSLVRELMQLHGGEILAANRADAHGAIFTARFPLQSSALLVADSGPPQAIALPGTANLDGLRVLLLDRDSEGRELVRTMLTQEGAMVHATESVEEALESLESWRPDVLVSDNGTSDHNSYSLVGKVYALEPAKGGRIPALALTNFARTDQRMRGLLEPAFCELPKPLDPEVLTAEIARLTGRGRRHAAR